MKYDQYVRNAVRLRRYIVKRKVCRQLAIRTCMFVSNVISTQGLHPFHTNKETCFFYRNNSEQSKSGRRRCQPPLSRRACLTRVRHGLGARPIGTTTKKASQGYNCMARTTLSQGQVQFDSVASTARSQGQVEISCRHSSCATRSILFLPPGVLHTDKGKECMHARKHASVGERRKPA